MTAIQKTLISFLVIGACVLVYTLASLFADAERITSTVIGEAHLEQRGTLAASGYSTPQRAKNFHRLAEPDPTAPRQRAAVEPRVTDVVRGAQPVLTRHMIVTADWLNLRSGPSVHAEKTGVLARGTTVRIVGEPSGQWIRIVAEDPADAGWAHANYVAPTRKR